MVMMMIIIIIMYEISWSDNRNNRNLQSAAALLFTVVTVCKTHQQ